MSHNMFILIVFSALNFQSGPENYCRCPNLKAIYPGSFSYHICLLLMLQGYILSRTYSMGVCHTFARPTFLLKVRTSRSLSSSVVAKQKHPNKLNVSWPSRMKKILITVKIINVSVPKIQFEGISLLYFGLLQKKNCDSQNFVKKNY